MYVSRESQRSTNTSEVEESADVRVIGNFCFQSDILLFKFRSCTLSKYRNQTRVIARALARPVDSKALQEAVGCTLYRSLSVRGTLLTLPK